MKRESPPPTYYEPPDCSGEDRGELTQWLKEELGEELNCEFEDWFMAPGDAPEERAKMMVKLFSMFLDEKYPNERILGMMEPVRDEYQEHVDKKIMEEEE